MRLDSRNADAYGVLGELYQKQGRDTEVEPAIQKAIDLAPGHWRYVNMLGTVYLSQGKYEQAVEQFRHAATLNPDNPRVFNNLGIAYLRWAKYPEAEAAFEKSIVLEPDYTRYSNLGLVFAWQAKYPEAVSAYQRALQLKPSDYLAWGYLAYAYLDQNDRTMAREALLKAIGFAEEFRKLNPNDPALLSVLGDDYMNVGQPKKGMPLLRQAVAVAPQDPSIIYKMAEGLELMHQRREALQWIERALSLGLPLDKIDRDPQMAKLRADPKFRAYVAKVR